jgi:hypothetical protein
VRGWVAGGLLDVGKRAMRGETQEISAYIAIESGNYPNDSCEEAVAKLERGARAWI